MSDDSPPARPLRIAVAGAEQCDAATVALAEEVGARLAQAGAEVLTGGRGGVMEAASRGAARAGGLTIGLLPGLDPAEANPYVRIPIPTGLGHGRNLIVAAGAQVVIALAGETGTLSEIALALTVGRPVVALHTWPLAAPDHPLPLFHPAQTAQEAVRLALALAAAQG
jgi:uncharacterized protein (TIGR00725 family)